MSIRISHRESRVEISDIHIKHLRVPSGRWHKGWYLKIIRVVHGDVNPASGMFITANTGIHLGFSRYIIIALDDLSVGGGVTNTRVFPAINFGSGKRYGDASGVLTGEALTWLKSRGHDSAEIGGMAIAASEAMKSHCLGKYS